MQETWVLSLGREDPLDKDMAWHPTLVGCLEVPWIEEPGGLMTHRVPKSQTGLKRLSTHAPQKTLEGAKCSFQFLEDFL